MRLQDWLQPSSWWREQQLLRLGRSSQSSSLSAPVLHLTSQQLQQLGQQQRTGRYPMQLAHLAAREQARLAVLMGPEHVQGAARKMGSSWHAAAARMAERASGHTTALRSAREHIGRSTRRCACLQQLGGRQQLRQPRQGRLHTHPLHHLQRLTPAASVGLRLARTGWCTVPCGTRGCVVGARSCA
jgi:hypothetical protein